MHEGLAELPVYARLFFMGLWCVADREGRFSWRPKRIKAEIMPYDEIDAATVLGQLEEHGFLRSYEVAGRRYGLVVNWWRHQIPNRDEPPSEIPSPDGSLTTYELPPNQTVRARLYARDGYRCVYCQRDMRNDVRARCLDHVVPYSKGGTNSERNLVTACKPCNSKKKDRTPAEVGMPWPAGFGDFGPTLTPPLTGGQQIRDKEGEGEREQDLKPSLSELFDRFWLSYPRKVGKDAAWREFQRLKPGDDLTAEMIAAVERDKASPQWRRDEGQYIPHPRTWLHQGRWKDEQPAGPQPTKRHWRDECRELHNDECDNGSKHADRMQIEQYKAQQIALQGRGDPAA